MTAKPPIFREDARARDLTWRYDPVVRIATACCTCGENTDSPRGTSAEFAQRQQAKVPVLAIKKPLFTMLRQE